MENYFRRKSGGDAKPLEITVLATLETPILAVEGDDTQLHICVNDLIFKTTNYEDIKLFFRNMTDSTVEFTIDVETPFQIKKIQPLDDPKEELDKDSLLEVGKNEILEVKVTFFGLINKSSL